MDFKSVAKNASVAFLAQGVSMCVSMMTTLLVPKVLGIEEYGYWQLFIFYSTYVGFCHLGLNDGVYLMHGGEARNEIDKRSINSQMFVGAAFQIAVALLVLGLLSTAELDGRRSFILICVALYMVIKNMALYLGFVFQSMNETKLYSVSCMLERFCFLVPLVALLFFRVRTFEGYVLAYLLSTVAQLAFGLWFARDFLCAGVERPSVAVVDAIASVRVGIKLMLANIASMLVLGIARASIDAAWGIEAFGQLSLTLSMVNFFLSFVTQTAMVLFPALRQVDEGGIRKFFSMSRNLLSIFMPAVYLLYFPISWLLAAWLPQYAGSLIYLPYLLPICVFESKMSICCTTYYKVVRREGELLRLNMVVSIFGAVGSFLGAFVFHSVHVVILSAVFSIAGRSLWAERNIARELELPVSSLVTLGELLVTIVFVVSAVILPDAVSASLYTVCYIAWLLLNRSHVRVLAVRFRRGLHGQTL